LGVHSLPQIHRDPFDRLLVSQAGIEDMAVCSSDPIFQSYDVEVVDLRDVS
jgi:PIN domain nuclease of toxin-antitoxin system